jgi:deoxycytidylate deaminase
MSKDGDNLIRAALGNNILSAAVKQSLRSTIETFKTGAVLFDKDGKIVETGCSHVPLYTWLKDKRSVHAEDHVLNKIIHIEKEELRHMSMLIYTLGKSGNPATCSKPCSKCAERLVSSGIKNICYLEKSNDNEWNFNIEAPISITERTNY